MGYIRAVDVLPEQLILEIQKYVDGQMLYITRKCEEHSRWGEKSGTRENLEKRDRHIFEEYMSGRSTSELSKKYYLSEKSIQRIIRKRNPF